MKDIISKLYEQRHSYIIIGLTGKTGSGCTTTAEILSKKIGDIVVPNVCVDENSNDHQRKKSIILNYFHNNWFPFTKISVSDIITTFILENSYDDICSYLKSKIPNEPIKFKIENYDKTRCDNRFFVNILSKTKNKKEITNEDATTFFNFFSNELPVVTKIIKQELSNCITQDFHTAYQIIGDNIRKSGRAIDEDFSPENIYEIAERINSVIKVLRIYKKIKN